MGREARDRVPRGTQGGLRQVRVICKLKMMVGTADHHTAHKHDGRNGRPSCCCTSMTVGRSDHHIDLEAVMVGVADPHTRRYCSPFDWSGDSSCTGGGMTVGLVDHHTASAFMMVGKADHHKTPKMGAVDEQSRRCTTRVCADVKVACRACQLLAAAALAARRIRCHPTPAWRVT